VAGQNLTLADAALKEDYNGPLRKIINDRVALIAQFPKNTRDLVGRRAIVPLHITRNTGVGSRLENEVLPEAGAQGAINQIINLRSHYGMIRLTRHVISRMDKDRGAFVKAIRWEMDGIKSDCIRDQNRQAWSTSDGKLATCGVTAAATVIVLATTTSEQQLVNLAEGMRVDIGTVANPQLRAANRKVTAVDFTNKTITVDGGAVTTAGTDFVFRQGAGGSGANQRELTGVQTQIDDTGSLFGVDPATYWQWAAIVEGNGGTNRPISENLVTKAVMRSHNRSGIDGKHTLWAEDGVYRSAVNVLQARHRIVNTLDLKGGHKAVAFVVQGDELPLKNERDAPPNKLWGIHAESFTEYIDEDWQWEDLDGNVLHLAPDRTHNFEALYFKFNEIATERRNAHFCIEDLEAA